MFGSFGLARLSHRASTRPLVSSGHRGGGSHHENILVVVPTPPPPQAHDGVVNGLTFTSDGCYLLSQGLDRCATRIA
jgi:hypothetical protein